MPNRLAHETSPYLLQHANNPVDWYPWGPEALDRARAEQKPIFLSIGYSACHWCHVMEHESFENTEIAATLNAKFVCIKVDREERPDLDQIYMNAVQLMTHRGGWPMSVFLTPELQPFFGGTYWPPHSRMGMPGFDRVLDAVDDAWQNRREMAIAQAAELTSHLQSEAAAGGLHLTASVLDRAVIKLQQAFDFQHGGFGHAPKFPHAMDLQLLLRVWRRSPEAARHAPLLEMVTLNLDKMYQGGIYDHLAGGFARYSVDERWLVPHFEKMLYDNGLLAGIYLDGFQATSNPLYARVARETFDYVLRYMTDPAGGFHSSEDADSEGEEGKFYVWKPAEIRSVLGPAAERFCYVYDISEVGNFEGHSILNLPKTVAQCASLRNWNEAELEQELAAARTKLLAARDQRVRPGKDDKILVSWNALMIDALARGAGILPGPADHYLTAARRAANFILSEMRTADGRLLHSWRQGRAKFAAYLDDYAYLINSLLSLYEADFDERWLTEANGLARILLDHFRDPVGPGFFFTADDHERLIARNKDLQDASVPSGNGMAATALLRLARFTGEAQLQTAAHGAIELAGDLLEKAPTAFGQLLIALDMLLGPSREIVLVGDPATAETQAALAELRRRYLPNHLVACRADPNSGTPVLHSLFAGKTASAGLTAYICENGACQAPVCGLEDFKSKLANP